RWSAANWKKATFGWLAFVLVAVLLGQAAGVVKLTEDDQGTGQSARAHAILVHAGLGQAARENVLVQSGSATVRQPAFRRLVDEVLAQVGRMPQVAEVRSPYAPGGGGQLSADGHSALVQLDLRGDAETASDRVQPLLAATTRVQR